MKLTKHIHASVELEQDGVIIAIDPGEFDKKSDKIATNANAVLITHAHGDHFDKEALTKALGENPDLKIYAPSSVVEALGSHGGRVISVMPGDEFKVGSVDVKVYGSGTHAQIHASIPTIDNVGFLVDNKVYHPGDSFDAPGVPVEVLLLPVSGPWFKLSEAADFVMDVQPQLSIPIHEAINSDVGNNLIESQLGKDGITGIAFQYVKPGKSIEI